MYTDVYNSDAAYNMYEELLGQDREEGDPPDLEYSIVMMGLWSDGTHLTQFSHAKLYPLYVYFLNENEYIRGEPSQHSAHHLAYIPSVRSDSCTLFRNTELSLVAS